MRVRLTATFELFAVELSAGFQVAAVLLKRRGSTVVVCNYSDSPGKPFEILEAHLTPSAELQSLLVRAMP